MNIELIKTALQQAIDAIQNEFCTHSHPCGPDNERCSAQILWQALREIERLDQ